MPMPETELSQLITGTRTKLGLGPAPVYASFQPVDSSAAHLARLIDHTILKPEATAQQVETLCDEAIHFGFGAVCINPANVSLAASRLQGTPVTVCAVAGFPLGATLPEVKAFEAGRVIAGGAREVDMVINIGALRSGDYALIRQDIAGVVRACRDGKAHCKVIIETCYLTAEEKVAACLLAQAAGADFVKTSTGFGPAGATVDDVLLMRRVVGPTMGLKAAGGIRDLATLRAMVQAGATRIGASSSVRIMQEAGIP
jgi:deoxyribose-phosphate aldolase